MNDQPALKDYLFFRCFSKKHHLEDFLSGKCLRMGSAESYWKMENGFQGDPFDCAVVSQSEDIKWSMWIGDDFPRAKICDASKFSIGIQAYLYCMFAVPKAFFSVKDGALYIHEESPYHDDFFRFLDEYVKSKGHAFVCAFDAASFMARISKRLQEKGLPYTFGFVTYADRTIEERMSRFINKEIEDIVFTKQKLYEYQREYRVVVNSRTDVDHFDIDGVYMDGIVFLSGEYNPKKEAATHAD